jgi:putative peptidoglycan lipid II flippase
MTIGTVISRVTGLLRLAAIAGALGIAESRLPDTYNLANTAPNIIYELVLGGILTSVFVPVFVELLEKEGRERAWEVASALINLSLAILTAITIIGIVASPWIADFYAGRLGDQADVQKDVLTFFLRLFIPQIVFYGLTAMTAGLLNAHKRFGAPMFTPILNNLTVIAVMVFFYQAYGKVNLSEITTQQILILGLGTTAGVAVMALAQIPFLRGLGTYRFTFSVRHPSVRKLAKLSLFVFGYVITNQIGYVIVQWLANDQQGAYSAYISAFTFFMLPHGLFAVSIITALLPGMSEHATNRRWDEFRERLSVGIRSTALLVLPAAVGYFVLGEAIVTLLQRGVLTSRSVDLVADVLRFFVVGLVPFSLFQLFLRAFYAMQDTKTPFQINVAAVALNTAINIPMFAWLGVKGLAAGHAIAYIFGVTLQGRTLSKRIGGLDGRRILRAALRIGGAALGMGVVVWGLSRPLEGWLYSTDIVKEMVALAVVVGAGAASYLALARLLRVEEMDMVLGLIRRRDQRIP